MLCAVVQAEGADATFLVLCRCNGTLEVFALPHMHRVATFLELHEGDAAVHAVPPPSTVRHLPLSLLVYSAGRRDLHKRGPGATWSECAGDFCAKNDQ